MKLICKQCNYETFRKKDYEKHILTQKHLKTIESMTCKSCGSIFTQMKNLKRHYKTICKDLDTKIEPIDNNPAIIEILNKMQEKMTIIENKLENQNDDNNNDKNMTTKKFVETHFSDAPIIQEIDTTIIECLEYDENENIKYVENMIYLYNNDSFYDFLGKIVLDNYLDDNPKNQTIWCADPARLKFIIKQKDTWIVDKDSQTIKSLIIDKILNSIKNRIKTYIQIIGSKIKKLESNILIIEKEYLIKNMTIATELLINIDNAPKKILKYIAPKMIYTKI